MRMSRARPRRARAAQKGAPPTRASPRPGTRSFERLPRTATGRTSAGLYARFGRLSSARGGGCPGAAAEEADRQREDEAHCEGGHGRSEGERGGRGAAQEADRQRGEEAHWEGGHGRPEGEGGGLVARQEVGPPAEALGRADPFVGEESGAPDGDHRGGERRPAEDVRLGVVAPADE